MKKVLCFFIYALPLFCIAQKQGNIWYFGSHAGLDFNSGIPVPLSNGQTYTPDGTPIEGTAVMSDNNGSLLFYTNGNKIWNRNQQLMPNGDSLFSTFSSTQGALIIPQPGSSRYYYVFTVDDFYLDDLKYGFRYSVVDICLDGGLGDVISNRKNIKLLDTVAEKLTGVRHANGTDYWIIVHKYYSDAFYSYHLASTGIVGSVISHIGSRHPVAYGPQNSGYALGYMKASPNGQKLVVVSGNGYGLAEYFDFNRSTGVVSNFVNIQADSTYCYYGASFSPDNSKLYIACWLNDNGVYQFDLTAGGGNPNSVRGSKYKVAGQSPSHWAMQLGTDGKIYIATDTDYLSVINNPNNTGANCNYADSVIHLIGGTGTQDDGLPNFIDSYDYSNILYSCTTAQDTCPEIFIPSLFSPNNDGNNDFECIYGDKCLQSLHFVVYDRWGEKVFETNNSKDCWDGTFKGQRMNSAVFVYYLTAILISGEQIVKSGNISLVR
jgi:gliding motility-associated-like protein